MKMSRLIISASVFVLTCVALVTMQAQQPGAGGAGRGDRTQGRRRQPVVAPSVVAAAQTRPRLGREIW